MSDGILISSDGRGKHELRPNAISNEIKETIRQHIKLFPRRQSHYSRSSNLKRDYLDEGLSISRMYQLYLKKYQTDTCAKPEVNEWLYRKIFNEEFNLSFGYPRSDTCDTCDLLNVATRACTDDDERAKKQEKLAVHQEMASQRYKLLRSDAEAKRESTNKAVITFDLMQNLPMA